MSNDSFPADEVFTPSSPARITFVERGTVNRKLVRALRTKGKQLIVYGHSKSGKTTLLVNKLHQLYEGHVTGRCMKGVTLDELKLDAIDQLEPYYRDEVVNKKSSEISGSLQAEFLGIKGQLGGKSAKETSEKWKPVLPPQLTIQRLARFLGAARCCWVLEDFHKVAAEEKEKLAQAMKVFMDTSEEYRNVKIIAIGAVKTAREVVEYDPEMKDRIAEIEVPLMDDPEIAEILRIGEEKLNFRLSDKVRDGIVKYSNGLPSVCHQLGFNICDAANIEVTLPEERRIGQSSLDKALEYYLDDASDTLKATFDKAFHIKRGGKYDHCRLIAQAIVESGQDGATRTEILVEIRKRQPAYPANYLTYYLPKLQTEDRGTLLRFDAAAGRYSFFDPIYRAYALTIFAKGRQSGVKSGAVDLRPVTMQSLQELLRRYVFGE